MGYIIGIAVAFVIGAATMKLMKAASVADDAKERFDRERI